MNYPEVTLGELADGKGSFVDGPFGSNLKASEYVDAGVPVMRLQNIRPNEYLPKDVKYITQQKADSLSRHNYRPGDVVIAKLGAVGTACIVPDYCDEGIIVADVVRFRGDKTRINHQYLCDFLNSPEGQDRVLRLSKGTTRLRTNLTDLKKIEVPLPPLDDQKRIAYVLGKVEGLIAQRKQHLQQLDDLLKSVFLEMFGDPVRNEKGWEKKPCSKVAEIITGHPFKSDFYTDDPTQLRLCGGLIIYPQRIEWDKCNYWPKELLPGLERYLLEVNDIVLAMDRPWISSGLKICSVDEIGCGSLLVQRTARLRAKEVEQYFLYAHLKDSSFTRHCKPTETTVPHISIKDIQTFQILCAPKQLQIRFALIAERIENIKSRYQQSLTDLETLYGALSQKAFKGELDLSRVPLPSEDTATTAVEPLETSEPPPAKEPFSLPDPSELTTLNSAEGRHALINQWLEAWLTDLNDAPFSPRSFIEAAQQRLIELAKEEDLPEWDAAEYNSVQAWVFEALGDRRLTQTYDDAKNRVQLHAVSPR